MRRQSLAFKLLHFIDLLEQIDCSIRVLKVCFIRVIGHAYKTLLNMLFIGFLSLEHETC